jgi:RNA polymerase sigma-70 factor (ECF subfamily)
VRAELGDEPRLVAAPSDAAGPDARAARGELAAALERALRELPPTYRDVVVLRDLEGLSAAEVGVALGLGERAVKSRLHRGRAAVRQALAAAERAPAKVAAPPRARCPDVVALLSRHLEGELDATVCSRMEAHVASCPACAGRCDGLRRSLAACRALGRAPVPPPLRAALRRAVRELRLPTTNS